MMKYVILRLKDYLKEWAEKLVTSENFTENIEFNIWIS